jgi:hypothetical protein
MVAPDNKCQVKWLIRMDFSVSRALLSPSEDNKPGFSLRDLAGQQAACG